MLKYIGRIGCSALTDLVLDHFVTLSIDISLIINGSFIVARAFMLTSCVLVWTKCV